MLTVNSIRDNKGARRTSKRLGRGIGSGKGKTSGRGGKGQTARSGVAIGHLEGGQTPLYRRLPKRGFVNFTRVEYQGINLWQLQDLLDRNLVKAGDEVTLDFLKARGLYDGDRPLKLLADGELKAKLTVQAHKSSKKAAESLEKLGGSFKAIEGAVKKAA